MITTIVIGFIGGFVVSQMFGAWFARQAEVVKSDILAEITKATLDVEKIKALVAKL